MTLFHSLTSAVHLRVGAVPPRHTVTRAVEQLLEGAHPWGSIDVTPAGRTSWSRTRLTVYPPGTTAAERRALHLHRTWPVAGAVVALFILLALSSLPPLAATAVAASVYATGLVAGARLTATLRPRLRRLTLMVVPTCGGLETVGDVAFFALARDTLRELDDLSQRGLVNPAEYERRWGSVYDALPPVSNREHRGLA